ncbi:MAG: hypothetical protein ACOVNQ_01230, partial [Pirellula sp.]
MHDFDLSKNISASLADLLSKLKCGHEQTGISKKSAASWTPLPIPEKLYLSLTIFQFFSNP